MQYASDVSDLLKITLLGALAVPIGRSPAHAGRFRRADGNLERRDRARTERLPNLIYRTIIRHTLPSIWSIEDVPWCPNYYAVAALPQLILAYFLRHLFGSSVCSVPRGYRCAREYREHFGRTGESKRAGRAVRDNGRPIALMKRC
jgi:hypothetical protein